MMRGLVLSLMIAALAITGCANLHAEEKHEDHDQTVTLDNCPAVVKATLQKEVGDGTIKEIEKENEDGKDIYSADTVIGGKPYEIHVSPDGTLLSKKLDLDDDVKKDGDKDHEDKEKGAHGDKDND
jgi:hypothetical protein